MGADRRGASEEGEANDLVERCERKWKLEALKNLCDGENNGFRNSQHADVGRHAKTAVWVFNPIGVAVGYRQSSHKEHESGAEKHEQRCARGVLLALNPVGMHRITITRHWPVASE